MASSAKKSKSPKFNYSFFLPFILKMDNKDLYSKIKDFIICNANEYSKANNYSEKIKKRPFYSYIKESLGKIKTFGFGNKNDEVIKTFFTVLKDNIDKYIPDNIKPNYLYFFNHILKTPTKLPLTIKLHLYEDIFLLEFQPTLTGDDFIGSPNNIIKSLFDLKKFIYYIFKYGQPKKGITKIFQSIFSNNICTLCDSSFLKDLINSDNSIDEFSKNIVFFETESDSNDSKDSNNSNDEVNYPSLYNFFTCTCSDNKKYDKNFYDKIANIFLDKYSHKGPFDKQIISEKDFNNDIYGYASKEGFVLTQDMAKLNTFKKKYVKSNYIYNDLMPIFILSLFQNLILISIRKKIQNLNFNDTQENIKKLNDIDLMFIRGNDFISTSCISNYAFFNHILTFIQSSFSYEIMFKEINNSTTIIKDHYIQASLNVLQKKGINIALLTLIFTIISVILAFLTLIISTI